MVTLTKIVIAALCGVILGLIVTNRSLERTSLGDVAGPWRGAPRDSTGEADPYALAETARVGLLPLGSAEGLSFVADRDSKGSLLRSTCDYAVEGPMPPARAWTLSLLTTDGFLVDGPADRYGFTSAEVLRLMGRPVTITIAHDARSGNWLPTGSVQGYVLMLRLYDTSLSSVGSKLDVAMMPKIERIACR